MRERVSQPKKATTTSSSIPSLKHPIRGFGLDSSEASLQSVPLVQPLNKPLGHDISRIPLRRPQAKLTVNHPGDIYEQEADKVAQQVMQRMSQPGNKQSVQPEASLEEEDELAQMKPTLQRQSDAGMAAMPDMEASINHSRTRYREKLVGVTETGSLEFLSAKFNSTVLQRVEEDKSTKQDNYYQEFYSNQPKKRRLDPITKDKYKKAKTATKTEEPGYTGFKLENNEDANKWAINKNILKLSDDGKSLTAIRGFKLPVSCIESAEHIVHHGNNNIPDWKPDTEPPEKSVELHFHNQSKGKNEKAFNISKDEISGKLSNQGYTDYDFNAMPLQLNQGLLVAHKNKAELFHAVAVVGIHQDSGQLIVVERNAGTTSGATNYIDANWVLNTYKNAVDFKQSMENPDFIIGKLVVG
ncbi:MULTISPECIES: hypothetical protein [unclassified Nostoc]|uniref:hypothetical protein n=1 Tax=unclassified Nostoc TaxID=2593658 RepID=UPI002AD4EC63|nr:hypothetical protein [Nostoc sp. DedQUE03]MDZ7970951.1 hypothetical protein [Nostoc sp. DedQUE03]MDZ8044365.1 hypothetical protein [Nostoc sp. DedQUE02]